MGGATVRALGALDLALLRRARTVGHGREAEAAMQHFSDLGEHAGVWLALGAAGALLDAQRRGLWQRATGLVAGAYMANTLVKLIVRRPRPRLAGLPQLAHTPTQLSFPSAHATSSFAGAYAFSRLGVARRPLYGLAAALAFSRVYLGVHYPSDVLAGAVLGTGIAAAASRRTPAGAPVAGAARP